MNVLTLDVETTTHNKGHWADTSNKLVMVGVKWIDMPSECYTTADDTMKLLPRIIRDRLEAADIVVGFNIKFDLHWLCNIGIDLSNIKRVWDCQIAEFLLEAQRTPYNSLNDACDKYNIPRKLDVVKQEYWDKGIDTTDIPVDILREYLAGDLDRTERVFKIQHEIFTGEII